MKSTNHSKFIRNKSKGFLGQSIISTGGVAGKELDLGSVMLLDNSIEVIIKSQRILKNFTTVSFGERTIEVRTERLSFIINYNEE